MTDNVPPNLKAVTLITMMAKGSAEEYILMKLKGIVVFSAIMGIYWLTRLGGWRTIEGVWKFLKGNRMPHEHAE